MGARRAIAPVLSGSVPPLAPGFQRRQETGFGLSDGLRPGETIMLVPAAGGDPQGGMTAAGATGGTGKTQLAVGFAHTMWSARAVDLLVWVPAGNRTAIIASYARATADLDMAAGDETADGLAQRFLGWLRTTSRRWAVVLDGVTSPIDLDGLWPQGPAGQVVVTSRLRASELSGRGRSACGVPGFSRREALAYLTATLTGFPDQRIEALDLAEDIGGLPIAMAQAAAVIQHSDSSCRDYRAEYDLRLRSTAGTIVDGCPQPLLATWSLAVEYAHEMAPAGLAWPALVFAAVLDGSGIPAAVLTSPAACGYITGTPSGGGATDQNLIRATYANLGRLGLLTMDTTSAVRTVWVHSAVRAAVRAYLAPGHVEQAVQAGATALLEAWPPETAPLEALAAEAPGLPSAHPSAQPSAKGERTAAAHDSSQLSQPLRDCTAALRAFSGDLLWKPEAHPVLLRAGTSLTEGPALADSAIGYWLSMANTASRLLGHGHHQSLLARERLADAYQRAGRLAEALTVFEAALTDAELSLGPLHPDTLDARVLVARSMEAAGREPEAIALYEQAVAARERALGAVHPDTFAVKTSLAAAYSAAGRPGDSIRLYEATLAAAELELGPAHNATLTARTGLAGVYLAAGRPADAIVAYQRALADRERASGDDDPATVSVRASLATAYRVAGRSKEAVAAAQRVLADRERLFGADHPDTITARDNLAFAYRAAGRLKDAIPQYERAAADRERVAGAEHRDTLAAQSILAAAYQLARRMREAVQTYERTVAGSEHSLGPGDIDTLTARCNLAIAYSQAGRLTDGVRELRRALADCEQYLGPDHRMTSTVRDNLRAATE
jgi:tetratricopeptide (TPR) repeat protein